MYDANLVVSLRQMAYLIDNTRCGGGYPARIPAHAEKPNCPAYYRLWHREEAFSINRLFTTREKIKIPALARISAGKAFTCATPCYIITETPLMRRFFGRGDMQNLPFVKDNLLVSLRQMAYLMDNTRCGWGYPARISPHAAVCYGWAVCRKLSGKL